MAINQINNCKLDLFKTCNEFERLEDSSLHAIEREFDDLCKNFSIQPNTPTNLKSQNGSSTRQFSNGSSYGFSELCNIYKDAHLSFESGHTKNQIDGECTAVKLIEDVCNEESDKTLKTSPISSTFSQSVNLDSTHKRNDVALKSSIRTIRRHIKNKFKQQNARLVRRRLCNIDNWVVIKKVHKMISETLPAELCTNDMAKYIIGVCKLKPINKLKLSDQLIDDINLFLNCAKQYSYAALLKLVDNNLFQTLCKVVNQDMIPTCLRQELENAKNNQEKPNHFHTINLSK